MIRQALRAGLAVVLPPRMYLVEGPAKSQAVCLTFDDGPDPEHTPRLLDVLGELGIIATFFVIGEKAERHPELVRRMAAEGHRVGHHSYSHTSPNTTPARQLAEEIQRTAALLGGLLGTSPTLFRPPYGKVTAAKLLSVWRAGQTIVLWNADPKDYACRTPAEVLGWFRQHPLASGDVVLMHDNVPHAPAVLPELVRDARDRGLTFADLALWAR